VGLATWYQQSAFSPTESVLFQSYRGEFATDSQLAIHAELRSRRPDLELLWGVVDWSVVVPEGGRALLIESREWYAALGSSRYLCRNIEFDRYFRKRPYQGYLQTFHGYPFKSMGTSLWRVQGRPESVIAAECARRAEAWDAIVVPESFCIDLYRREYGFTGNALVTGYPRNDALVTADTASVRSRVLGHLGIDEDRIVVLYAPTWRDTGATGAWSAKFFDDLDLKALAEHLGDRYAVLLRGHNYNLREGLSHTTGKVWDVSAYPEINDLLLAADVAVLDYSSIRFDWLITGKPVVFFVPDLEDYLRSRKVLFDFSPTAPGPLLATTAEVVEALLDLGSVVSEYAAARELFNKEFNRLHDGHATERVIDAFF
jgi:CDP-glycerol glycerophosphotransferase